jgi:hypothetical protein
MILLNFSHPLTREHLAQVEHLAGEPVEQVVDLPVQFDNDQAFEPQLENLLAGLSLAPETLQTGQIVVNLPSLNYIAALLLAELHGRMGYFPPVLRLRPGSGALPPRYEVAEVLNLQAVRDQARRKRY